MKQPSENTEKYLFFFHAAAIFFTYSPLGQGNKIVTDIVKQNKLNKIFDKIHSPEKRCL